MLTKCLLVGQWLISIERRMLFLLLTFRWFWNVGRQMSIGILRNVKCFQNDSRCAPSFDRLIHHSKGARMLPAFWSFVLLLRLPFPPLALPLLLSLRFMNPCRPLLQTSPLLPSLGLIIRFLLFPQLLCSLRPLSALYSPVLSPAPAGQFRQCREGPEAILTPLRIAV